MKLTVYHHRWFVALCGTVVQQHLELLRIDLRERHAADVDDICFSLGAAAIFAGSYAASPPGTTRHQRFALLMVLGAIYIPMVLSWVVEWVVLQFKQVSGKNEGQGKKTV